MKTALLILLLASSTHAQSRYGSFNSVGRQAEARWAAVQKQKILDFIPKDPWREIEGQTNYAKGGKWVQFCGKVLEVQPNGIRISGDYGVVTTVRTYGTDTEFFVAGFPYEIAEDELISTKLCMTALEDGLHVYNTTQGGSRSIRKLSYGKVSTAPEHLIKKKLEAAKTTSQTRADAAKTASVKALEFNRTAADNGDAYGQFRMGERYRDGDGVEADEKKAREYFTKSAAQGNKSAERALQKLSNQ